MYFEKRLKEIVQDETIFKKLYGNNTAIIESKRKLILDLWKRFKSLLKTKNNDIRNLSIIMVPNRVEILGKHTDYQGGRTLLLTGPKSFTSISAGFRYNLYKRIFEFINLKEDYGNIKILKENNKVGQTIKKGFGWQYSLTVINRVLNNFPNFKIDPMTSIFSGDIPIGGGTSGSSAKVIMDFLSVIISNNLINNADFINTIIENGKLAGVLFNQHNIDNFKLALSMYIANYENGLDYGNLKGDKGVGTFGGSEDHTAILLGEKDHVMLCRYCPTQLIKKIKWPKELTIVVAFSGRKAEKTTNTKEKYNLLSLMASKAVETLNNICGTDLKMLRDFFKDQPSSKKADMAHKKLKSAGFYKLAERVFQFYKEEEIIEKATDCLLDKRYANFGEYVNESHRLSREYLKNIVHEIDSLQKGAVELGAIGASGFGAGFGGSCYAIVKSNDADDFIKEWKNLYIKKFPQHIETADFNIYPPCHGAYWEEIHD